MGQHRIEGGGGGTAIFYLYGMSSFVPHRVSVLELLNVF
jgi:hypothetical protein